MDVITRRTAAAARSPPGCKPGARTPSVFRTRVRALVAGAAIDCSPCQRSRGRAPRLCRTDARARCAHAGRGRAAWPHSRRVAPAGGFDRLGARGAAVRPPARPRRLRARRAQPACRDDAGGGRGAGPQHDGRHGRVDRTTDVRSGRGARALGLAARQRGPPVSAAAARWTSRAAAGGTPCCSRRQGSASGRSMRMPAGSRRCGLLPIAGTSTSMPRWRTWSTALLRLRGAPSTSCWSSTIFIARSCPPWWAPSRLEACCSTRPSRWTRRRGGAPRARRICCSTGSSRRWSRRSP